MGMPKAIKYLFRSGDIVNELDAPGITKKEKKELTKISDIYDGLYKHFNNTNIQQEFTIDDKISYYEKRSKNKRLTKGQRDFALRRTQELLKRKG